MVAGRPGLACFPSGGGRRLPVIESGCESGGCRGWNRGSWTKKTHRRDRAVRVSGQRQDDAAQPPAAGTGLFGRGGDHQRVWRRGRGPPPVRLAQDNIMLVEGGCLCCAVSGAVVDALRDLFMLALRRQIKPFRRVLIETSGLADPAPVLFTLKHDRFGRALCLSRRHRGRGCAAWRGQLADQPEAARQLALADTVVFSKADRQRMPRCRPCNGRSRPSIRVQGACSAGLATGRGAGGLAGCRDAAGGAVELVAGVCAAGGGQAWHGVQLQPDTGCTHWSRGLPAGISLVQERYGQGLLRLKGLVCFEGETLPCEVHGVHGELYPLRTLPQWPSDERASRRCASCADRTRPRCRPTCGAPSASCPHETVGARIAPFAVSHVRKMHGNTV